MTTTQEPLWKVKTVAGYAGGSDNSAMARLEIYTHAQTVEDIRRKVEAMPDLLRACQAALEWIKDDLSIGSPGLTKREIELAEQLQAAISKSS